MPPDSDAKEYCPSQNFNASCPGKNDVIVMDSARYGRMRQGRCVTGNYGNLGCSRDVLWYFDSLCSGRRRCKVYIADQVLHRLNPCQQELVSYLEAKYHCVTGAWQRWLYLNITYFVTGDWQWWLFKYHCVTGAWQRWLYLNITASQVRDSGVVTLFLVPSYLYELEVSK